MLSRVEANSADRPSPDATRKHRRASRFQGPSCVVARSTPQEASGARSRIESGTFPSRMIEPPDGPGSTSRGMNASQPAISAAVRAIRTIRRNVIIEVLDSVGWPGDAPVTRPVPGDVHD